jgi:hypothetical protein
MTKNGLRVPCPCHRKACNGAVKDYRTVQTHARLDAADIPLFPADHDEHNGGMEDAGDHHGGPEEQEQHDSDLDVDDIVSHAETLPKCYEPICDPVRVFLCIVYYLCVWYTVFVHSVLSWCVVHCFCA